MSYARDNGRASKQVCQDKMPKMQERADNVRQSIKRSKMPSLRERPCRADRRQSQDKGKSA